MWEAYSLASGTVPAGLGEYEAGVERAGGVVMARQCATDAPRRVHPGRLRLSRHGRGGRARRRAAGCQAVACTVRFGPGEAIEDDTFVLELRLGKLGKPAVVRAAALVAALTAEPETGTKQDIRNQWMRRREAVLS